jgi:hypothetical protein
MNVSEVINEIETVGVALRLDGESVRIWYPDERLRTKVAEQVELLRRHRAEIVQLLKFRSASPAMPSGVRLVQWNLINPPVLIETFAVVTDSALFAKTTLVQLRLALGRPSRWVGWSVPQLINRLAQVGVIVALEHEERK